MPENKITTGIKLKLDFEKPEDKKEMNDYFEEYGRVATFAARKINEIRKSFSDLWILDENGRIVKDETKRGLRPKGMCDSCKTEKELIKKNSKNEKLCLSCYSSEYGKQMIRKKLIARARSRKNKAGIIEPPRKVDPSLNIMNAGSLANTTYHLAVRDAMNTLNALVQQRKKKVSLLKRDKLRLRTFKEILETDTKRFKVPPKKRERSERYVHINDKKKGLRGWTIASIKSKIKILERNTKRVEISLSKPTPIKFKGSKISLHNDIVFNLPENKVRIPLWKSKWYKFFGTNVANAHGKKFFSEKLAQITPKKYGSLVRVSISKRKKSSPDDYEFYLQYPIGKFANLRQMQNIMGVDIGLNKLFAVSIFHPNEKKPFFVRIVPDEALGMRRARRRQSYGLRFKHNKRQKLKRMRDIEPRITQYYHTKTKEIVNWANENNAVIVMENLEDMKKKSRMGERKENRYKLSQFVYKTLRSLIAYKAALKGIPIILIAPEGTSYTCSKCGGVDTQRPKQAIFKCNNPQCELNADGKSRAINADYNASCNIANKGLNSPEMKQYLEHSDA